MIFDTPAMQKLRDKFKNVPDFDTPEIVLLDRSQHLLGERAYLEEIMRLVPEYTQKKWVNNLLSIDVENHMGTWFEIMLFGWMQDIGRFTVQPEIEDGSPDITLHAGKDRIFVEAKTILTKEADREKNRRIAAVLSTLKTISLPFGLSIEQLSLKSQVDASLLSLKVKEWLESTPDQKFVFEDRHQNIVVFTAMSVPEFDHVVASGPAYGVFVNPEILKKPIKKKTKQHRQFRNSGYPYIIALYLDPFLQSAEEVVEAWFGKERWIVDVNKNEVITKNFDQSGLHFYGWEILHKSVSGTLVFKTKHDDKLKRRVLDARYIQNPFAKIWVDPFLFPVHSSYTIVEFAMSWRTTPKM
jgi:hypothetical protein